MKPITPENAEFLLHAVALPTLKNEHRATRAVIEAIPNDKGDYRPDPFAKSAMELAWHIVAAENRFLQGIASGAFDFTPHHRPDTIRNSSELGAWYAQNFEGNIQRLTQVTPEQLLKPIDFRGMFQHPAVMYLTFAINHSVHHRGQLSTYLRPMGSKVPSIYGESYDTAEAKKAAEARAATS